MRQWRLLLPQGRRSLRRRLELCPVDLTIVEIIECDLADRDVLAVKRGLSVVGPVVSATDNPTANERLLARRGEEAVDVGLLDSVVRSVELALNGMELSSITGLCN